MIGLHEEESLPEFLMLRKDLDSLRYCVMGYKT